MATELNLEKESDEKYRAWLEDRHNPLLQTDVWITLRHVLDNKPKDWKALTRLAYVSRYMNYGYDYAIEFAKKTLELKPNNNLIKLFMADTFYEWGLGIQNREKIKEALEKYDEIFRENPTFSYFNHITNKKRLCIKKLYG